MQLFRANDSFTRSCGLRMTKNADGLRFLIDGVIGNVVASISVIFNVLLFYVFSTSKRLRRQNYANPVLLALFDVITSVCYVLLLPAHVIAYRYSIRPMIEQWIHYVRFVHCVQHVCVCICNFLLVVASIERLFANSPEGKQKTVLVFLVRRKVGKIMTITLLAIVLKGTVLFETEIEYLPYCDELERYVPVLANYLGSFAAVRYWGRKISTVIVPFFILIYCNYRIVLLLRQKQKQTQQQSMKKRSMRGSLTSSSIRHYYREKRGVRTATKTLVLVVGCYLLSNFVSILLGFWEYLAPSEIIKYYYGYLVVSDIASLLTVFGCLMRLPIYCVSDARIRKAVGRALFRCRVRTIPTEVRQNQLDKWSFVVVSNSLRSNLTGMNNLDWMAGRSKRAKDELAFLLQNRRKILVDMAFRLAMDNKMENCDNSTHEVWLTDIQEEELLPERRHSRFRSLMANV
ncbi:hypothetical protein Y032_0231g2997 [Ancylostoma ceylanicum]|uniref:G-protein coupled receptors family 1 profile domain-containing protein n=2 Tax=Ancylostoma ceylanicum TaxID=53326 RepID=A0A016SGJ9_9BILA|nr:hypothetical protein Y032_0231g2997 [Ancylostoma ceylanicum]